MKFKYFKGIRAKKITHGLKDFFIPHAGNNFKPQSLHPERLLFHALSAVVIKVIVVGFLLAYPISAWLTPDIYAERGKEIINLTNELRASLSLPLLHENFSLDQAAYKKVQDMFVNQYFEHISPENKGVTDWLRLVRYEFALGGENLAMGFSEPKEVVEAWKKSKTHYANLIDPDFKEIGVAMASDKFENKETTFIAQFFGTTGENNLVRNQNRLVIDNGERQIYISETGGEKIVKASISLNEDTENANVFFGNFSLQLQPSQEGKWTGEIIIPKKEARNLFDPAILPTLSTISQKGEILTSDLSWDNLIPMNPSTLQEYSFKREKKPGFAGHIINFSYIYFDFLAIILFLALSLNIFIEIRKQHPRLIFYSLGTLGLFAILILI